MTADQIAQFAQHIQSLNERVRALEMFYQKDNYTVMYVQGAWVVHNGARRMVHNVELGSEGVQYMLDNGVVCGYDELTPTSASETQPRTPVTFKLGDVHPQSKTGKGVVRGIVADHDGLKYKIRDGNDEYLVDFLLTTRQKL